MSNVLTNSPIIVDTAGAGVLLSKYFECVAIRWTGPGTAADTAVVQDKNGNARWKATASTTKQDEQTVFHSDQPLKMDGLIVPTLASGTLYIYIKGAKTLT